MLWRNRDGIFRLLFAWSLFAHAVNILCAVRVTGQCCGPCLLQLSAQGRCFPGTVTLRLCNLLIKKLPCFARSSWCKPRGAQPNTQMKTQLDVAVNNMTGSEVRPLSSLLNLILALPLDLPITAWEILLIQLLQRAGGICQRRGVTAAPPGLTKNVEINVSGSVAPSLLTSAVSFEERFVNTFLGGVTGLSRDVVKRHSAIRCDWFTMTTGRARATGTTPEVFASKIEPSPASHSHRGPLVYRFIW